jgi:TRAP-type C4-dicarboxylate transport system substrate-binding protein
MSVDLYDELSAEDKKSFVEAAKLAGQASRAYAAEAQAKGATALGEAGMQVVAGINRDQFVAAMASAKPEFEKRFGADLIQKIQSVN